jgi:hypothetical protein
VVARTSLLALVLLGGIAAWSAHASTRVPELPPSSTPDAPASTSAGGNPPDAPPTREAMQFDLAEDPAFHSGFALRPLDRDIFAAMADPHLDRTRLPDLFPQSRERVRLLGSVAEGRFAQVLIDRDRNGTWDEKWDLKPHEVSRVVTSDPGSDTAVRYTLSHGRWQAH